MPQFYIIFIFKGVIIKVKKLIKLIEKDGWYLARIGWTIASISIILKKAW